MKNIVVVLNAPSGASDVNLVGKNVFVTSCKPFNQNLSLMSAKLSGGAGTQQVSTITPAAAAAGTTYSFSITQNVSTGTITRLISYTAISGDTTTTICDAFRTILAANGLEVVGSGTATCIITANAGYNTFDIASIASTTVATGTAGVARAGSYAQVLAMGGLDAVSGRYYDQYTVITGFNAPIVGGEAILNTQPVLLYIFVDKTSSAANALAFEGAWSAIANNYTRTVDSNAATLTLGQGDNGSTVLMNRAAGTVVTLPAATDALKGWSATFVYKTTITSNSGTVQGASSADLFVGSLSLIKSGAAGSTFAANGSSDYKVASNGTTTGGIAGGVFTVTCLGANSWLVTGNLQASGTVATPFA
jgi:hypothetical protein